MLEKLKFPKERLYPVAFATFLMYIAWHPLGDFIESLIIGWRIVPGELFTRNFWHWFIPLIQNWQHCYLLAFFAYFIPITLFFYLWYFLFKKWKLNKIISYTIFIVVLLFFIIPSIIFPAFVPSSSVAYQNDIEGFRSHGMEPLNLWMYFHMGFWFIWMVFPHILGLFTKEKTMLKISGIVWIVFLIVWISSALLGKFIYVPMGP